MADNIKEQVRKNTRMLNHHIGLGSDAHAAVNDLNAGFMTPDQKKTLETASEQADNAEGNMKYMADGTDVLTLPAGNYWISNALNNPVGPEDRSLTNYRVFVDSQLKRKELWATVSNNGRVYHRTIHSGGSATSGTNGWVCEPYLVWGGSITSGSIDISGGLSEKINGLKVRLRSTTGQSDTVEMMGTTNASIKTIPNISNDLSDPTFQLYEIGLTFDGKNLIIDSNNTIVAYKTGGLGFADLKGIMVTEVYAI